MSQELGDELLNLANANAIRDTSAQGRSSGNTPAQEQDDYVAAEVEAELDESAGEEPVAPEVSFAASTIRAPLQDHQTMTFAGQQPAYRPAPPHAGKKKSSEFKAIAAPILMTVGAMLLIPAFWAVLVLAGASVPMADREDAPTMAKVMLLCWPLALSLIVPATFIFLQLAAERKNSR